eukprot:6132418-Ditylum_brightwellii.AAC.2
MFRERIDDYNKAYANAIEILKHCIGKTSATVSKGEEDAHNEESMNIISKDVDSVVKFFPGHGGFKRKMTKRKSIHWKNWTSFIGEIVFEFVKKFSGGGVFNGKGIQIFNHCKQLCKFNDGKQHAYTLSQL